MSHCKKYLRINKYDKQLKTIMMKLRNKLSKVSQIYFYFIITHRFIYGE